MWWWHRLILWESICTKKVLQGKYENTGDTGIKLIVVSANNKKNWCSIPTRQAELVTKRRLHAFIYSTPNFTALKLSHWAPEDRLNFRAVKLGALLMNAWSRLFEYRRFALSTLFVFFVGLPAVCARIAVCAALQSSFTSLRMSCLRYATERYSNSRRHIDNEFMHLTNYSINKNSGGYRQYVAVCAVQFNFVYVFLRLVSLLLLPPLSNHLFVQIVCLEVSNPMALYSGFFQHLSF